ncbi:UvrD-helicase domain-containing protein [Saccharopolyspora dendranthemae]|uniref:DNA 3'-5' helicase n=1 Tax=Saccharopolyspora dendranthemae TaxID=1181886 RepID=A0A561U1X2_9PSEU|nr:UvrD-helicase domain-containing protein [Saccharopolyspora dendranthemae]TWF93352.1 UvrD-like helicase family protein [Saccharopolyspora dendranthemae]
MTGSFHHRQELLRREAEVQLRDRPLPSWQKRVLHRFAVERDNGWYPLLNQFAPHTPRQRPDLVLVGRMGVLVVLLRETEPDWEDSRAAFVWTAELLAGASIGSGMLSESVLSTVVVHPVEHTGRKGRSTDHLAITEDELDRLLKRGEQILTPDEVLALAKHLDSRTFDLTPIMWNSQRIPNQRGTVPQVLQEQVAASARHPFRDWRYFLDDAQLGAVRRSFSGPAQISGPAGTGKTTLALHRLAFLARRGHGKLLYTAPLAQVPERAASRFGQMAPELSGQIEFGSLHSWARDFLAGRGRPAEVDEQEVRRAFDAVWSREEVLPGIRNSPEYWKDEIDRVIKGRGVSSFDAYRTASRKGRGGSLPTDFRSHAWRFYCDYERELSERDVFDHSDVLKRALAELERRPLPRQYTAVVVDEAQELTLVGLRLAHAISGDEPDQLLLVGDGQQQASTGGWRLSEAGISLHGRGEVLRHDYRNRGTVLERAGQVEAVNRYDDGPSLPLSGALAVRSGGRVVDWHGHDQERALLGALLTLDDESSAAIITESEAATEHWLDVLRGAGVKALPLASWDGRDTSDTLVGTVLQAKGTEFRTVFLPAEPVAPEDTREDREAHERRRLVAMTRAQDHLWLSHLTRTR